MPAAPEFFDGEGGVRMLKVFFEVEAKHPSQADCHIAVPAEIKINLHSICDCPNPCAYDVQGIKTLLENLVCGCCHGICKEYFFCQAADKASQTQGGFF